MIEIRQYQGIRAGQILHDPVDTQCSAGDILCIMGASGVGKSTLLDSIRGYCDYQGTVICRGTVTSVYPSDNQLLPWYSIKKNFDLVVRDQQWIDTAHQWGIADLIHKKPGQISSGQKQRFVLLRALYMPATVMLCDEPMNNLDRDTAHRIMLDFRQQVRSQRICCLWVTHDVNEAAILSDRVLSLTSHRSIPTET